MIGHIVMIKNGDKKSEVEILDKIRIEVVGSKSNPDRYLVVDRRNKVFLINPINIEKMIE